MGRSAALVLVGLWLGLLVASWVVATVNFRTVDRVLGSGARPELQARLAPIPPDDRRMALRHLASEINRWMFGRWAVAQVLLAALVLGLAWRAGGAARWVVGAGLLIAVVQILLGRPIVDLGRSIDFVPRPLPPDVARRFGLLHAAFVLLDLGKAALLLAAAVVLARRPAP